MKRKIAITCAVAGNAPFNRNHSCFPVTPKEICAAAVEAAEAGYILLAKKFISEGLIGLGLVDHGVHLIGTFAWLMDARVTSVFGCGNTSGGQMSSEFACLMFDNGVMGYLIYDDGTFSTDLPNGGTFSWGAAWDLPGNGRPGRWPPHPGSIHVHGTSGALRANELFLTTKAGCEKTPLLNRPAPAQFALQIESFCDSIRLDTAPSVTGEEGLVALCVLRGIYESFETGRLTPIDGQLATGAHA